MPTTLMRVESASGLALALAGRGGAGVAVVLDFDRTVTNGFAGPDDTALDRRVRGGAASVEALAAARAAGARLFVVSARHGRELVLDAMLVGLSQAQRELKPLLVDGDGEDDEEDGDGVVVADGAAALDRAAPRLARAAFRVVSTPHGALGVCGRIYATDYKKPAAIEHVLTRIRAAPDGTKTVVFVDDFVGNACDVANWAPFGEDPKLNVVSVWWDPFAEEVAGSMKPVALASTDCSYREEYAGYLAAAGVDRAAWQDRLAAYKTIAPAVAAKPDAPPPPPKPVAVPAGFAKLFGERSGGRPPPELGS